MAELLVNGVGNVVSEPKLNYVGEKKTPVCNMNLAFNRTFKDKDGEYQNEAAFIWAKVWGKRAETFAKLAVGTPVYVSGYLQMSKGEKGNFYSVVVNQIHVCERNNNGNTKTTDQNTESNNKKEEEVTATNDDLPF